jgi:translation initiation factor 1
MSRKSKMPRVQVEPDAAGPSRLAQPFAALAGLRDRLLVDVAGEAADRGAVGQEDAANTPAASKPAATDPPRTAASGTASKPTDPPRTAAPAHSATPAPARGPAVPPRGAGAAKVPVGPARAVIRYERKGRGGKEVTLVEKLGLGAVELEAWCRELKRGLGCGGYVEGGAIVLAGDQRGRLRGLLEARGVRRVSVG